MKFGDMKAITCLIVLAVAMCQSVAAKGLAGEQGKLERFVPGEVWLDTGGKPIQAHGGGILVRGNTYYWYGEDRTPGKKTGVSCYSSTDLYNWKHEGVVLSNGALPSQIRNISFIERPKVIFNPRTGKYVMWMHLEQRGYHYARAGIAISDRPTGPFVFLAQMRPIKYDFGYKDGDPDRQKEFGGTFRDMNLFVDDDSKAYVFYASEHNATMYVVRLNDEFTGPEMSAVQNKTWARILVGRMREAPAPFKFKDRYYLITSGCTGWTPNPADYVVAYNILGPWESRGNPCVGPEADATFRAQSTFVLPVPGKLGCYIFMADRWSRRRLHDSRYVWQPFILKPDGTFTIEWHDEWNLSVFERPGVAAATSSARIYVDFDFDWRFSKGDSPTAVSPEFDDSGWRKVNLPHDWSIEGPFSADYASGTGYVPGGVGWYRKHFRLDPAHKGKVVAMEFDGVYNNSIVWVNGQFMGRRPYGYSSFQYDLTPHLKFGSDENVIAVRVDHTKFADSRWYTGSGIYRHVRLRITDKLQIGHWGTYVTTPEVKEDSAVVRIETTVKNGYDRPKAFSLQSDIITAEGRAVASLTTSGTVDAEAEQTLVQQITIDHPQLWSIESPTLYTLKSRLKADANVVDETSTPFGIRTTRFDPDKGFLLNGKHMNIKGVCLHHDAGCLGAAVPEKVLERRLRLMKELGANAVRTSHNPPAPELLDLCDRLGLLVKNEAFDEFTPPKNKWVSGRNVGLPSRYGYGEIFAQWSIIDMQDMVSRDRNHPSVFMWSIGNEIDYANDPFSHPVLGKDYRPEHPPAQDLVKHAKPLVEAVKKMDRTRPVTAALANIAMSDAVGLTELLDIVGYNYQESRYQADHHKYPDRFIFGSENRHQYRAWALVRDNNYVAGQFLWTGIDYLGEAGRWPNKAHGSGLLDLCGFKKPTGWFRQSLWSDEPMVYVCVSGRENRSRRWRGLRGAEHWNWPKNQTVTVLCCTNCPEVSLAINNKPIGTKQLSESREGVLSWEVPYEPGVLRAVGRKNGRAVCEYVLKTAGPASRIKVLPDVTRIRADGKDICHLEFRIVDDRSVRVPDAQHELTFEVDGPGEIIGIENGDRNSHESYNDRVHKAYHGRGLAILQSTTVPGEISLKVTSPGLEPATLTLMSQ